MVLETSRRYDAWVPSPVGGVPEPGPEPPAAAAPSDSAAGLPTAAAPASPTLGAHRTSRTSLLRASCGH
eukprot:12459735-Alexandrium_andersonii.AAC.1